MSSPASYRGIALVSPVSLGYSKTSEHGAGWFIGSVLRELIAAAGISKDHKGADTFRVLARTIADGEVTPDN